MFSIIVFFSTSGVEHYQKGFLFDRWVMLWTRSAVLNQRASEHHPLGHLSTNYTKQHGSVRFFSDQCVMQRHKMDRFLNPQHEQFFSFYFTKESQIGSLWLAFHHRCLILSEIFFLIFDTDDTHQQFVVSQPSCFIHSSWWTSSSVDLTLGGVVK